MIEAINQGIERDELMLGMIKKYKESAKEPQQQNLFWDINKYDWIYIYRLIGKNQYELYKSLAYENKISHFNYM